MNRIQKFLPIIFIIYFSNFSFASHFRAGKIEWTVTPGTRTVNFTIISTWRFDDVDPIVVNFGDGISSSSLTGTEILSVPNDYKVIQTNISHTYSSDGPFTVTYTSCCRISNLFNGSDDYFYVSSKVCLANSNSNSPKLTNPTLIEMSSTGLNSYQLNGIEPDGGPLTYSLSAISGNSYIPQIGGNAATISNTGLVSWNTTGTTVGSLYLMKVKLSDGCAEIEHEFIIKIVACNNGVTGTISGTKTIFQGQSTDLTITFTGFGPWTYRLSGTTTDVTTSVSPTTVTVNPLTTTNYTLTSVSGAGGSCGITNGVATVTVNCYNIATLTGNSTINSAQTTNLSISFSGVGPWTYRLSGTNTDITTSTSPVIIPVTPNATTVYSLTSVSNTSGFCSTSSGTATVTVNCPNVATLTGATTIISGQSTDLSIAFTGTPPWSYRLSGTNTDVTTSISPVIIPVIPNTSTSYSLTTVTHSNGFCASSTGNPTVTVNCPIVASISGTKTIFKGQSTDLTINFIGTGPWTYRLSGTNIDVTTNISPVVITVNPTINTTYSLISVTHSGGYCANTDGGSAIITVICPVNATLSGTATINKGQSTNLQISFTEAGPWTYRISGVNQDFTTSSNPVSIPVAPASTTTFTLSSVSNSCGFGTVNGSAVITVIVPVNLISCYNFSGNAFDGKGNSNGTVFGAMLTTDRFGNANSAYNFNGSNSYIDLANPNNFIKDNFTYSAWVNTSNLPPLNDAGTVVSVGKGQCMVLVNRQTEGPVWGATIYNNQNLPYDINPSTTSNTSINAWHHVVIVRSDIDIRIYVDGILFRTSTTTSITTPTYLFSPTIFKATIGTRPDNSNIQFFSGKIDDVKIYDGALKEEEVVYLFNEESGSNQCSDFCTKFVYTINSGKWNDPTIWSCNRLPLSSDVVLLKQNHTIIIDNITANAKSVILGGNIEYLNSGTIQLGN